MFMAIGAENIKKIISLFSLILMIGFVTASAPPIPMPIILEFTYNDQPVNNLQVELYYNSEKIVRSTNELGKLMVDVGTGSPDFASTRIEPNGNLRVVVLNVDKTYSINSLDYPFVDSFVLTSSPPVSCPSCPSCGGGGGSGVIYKCTLEEAQKLVTCPVINECSNCPLPSCPTVECPTQTCDCPTSETPSCPDNNSPLNAVFAAIVAFLIGGGAVYIGFGTANKVKVKKVNGVDTAYHQHPLVSGYHNPNTIHKIEPHAKGELLPKYMKDSAGKWHYQG